MKKLFLSLSLLFGVLSFASAQGNLQFNQVIVQDFTATISSWTTATVGTITVPAGKVWKVEHADLWRQNSLRQTYDHEYSLFINNILIHRAKGSTGSGNNYTDRLPVWLPAGTYSIIISNEDSSSKDFVADINAIEFNVTP